MTLDTHVVVTGSGLAIYVVVAGNAGINSTVSVDDDLNTVATLPAPGPPQFSVVDEPLFIHQSLTSGEHNVTLALLSWNEGQSFMFLDYISINETYVPAPTYTSASATYTSASATPTHSIPHSLFRLVIVNGRVPFSPDPP